MFSTSQTLHRLFHIQITLTSLDVPRYKCSMYLELRVVHTTEGALHISTFADTHYREKMFPNATTIPLLPVTNAPLEVLRRWKCVIKDSFPVASYLIRSKCSRNLARVKLTILALADSLGSFHRN